MQKRIFAFLSGFALTFASLATVFAVEPVLALDSGTLIKGALPAVYYFSNGKRYVFPDEKTYFTWYGNFDTVIQISDVELAAVPLGGNVRYRPGTKLIKITSDPKVYAVGDGGLLRWLSDESVAKALFGLDWANQVNDLSDAFFVNYGTGQPVTSVSSYEAMALREKYRTIGDLVSYGASGSGQVSIPVENPVQVPANISLLIGPSQIVPSVALSGTVIYVSKAGSDATGNGSASKPFLTISKASAATQPGNTVLLLPGTYNEAVRIRQAHITIASAGPSRAIIHAPLPSQSGEEDSAVMVDVDADGAILRDLIIEGGYYGVSMETRWDWGDADRSGVSDVMIENSIVRHTGHDAIKVKPNVDRVTIKHNEIYDTGLENKTSCNAEGVDNVNGDDLLVQANLIHDTCTTGVYCKGGATNCRILDNKIYNTGAAGILVGFDTSPEYFDLKVNPGYYENISATVRNNLVLNTQWAGIGLYASKNALIENNTVVNAGKEYHAPLYYGVTFQDWDDTAKRPANINPVIRNNVFVQQTGWPTLVSQIRYANELGGLSGLAGAAKLSGNCYFTADGSGKYEDRRPDSEYSGVFVDWVKHMSESSSYESNPSLDVNYQATSVQCKGKGWKML